MIIPLYEYGMMPSSRVKWLENGRFGITNDRTGIALTKSCSRCDRDIEECKERELKDISKSCLSLLWIPCSHCVNKIRVTSKELQCMTDCILQEYYEDMNGGLGFFCDCDSCAIRFNDVSDWIKNKRVAHLFRDFAIETVYFIWNYVPSSTSKRTHYPDCLLGRFYPELYCITRRINNNCFIWSLMASYMNRFIPQQMRTTAMAKRVIRMIDKNDQLPFIPIEIIDKIISYCFMDTSEWVEATYNQSMISLIEAREA